MRGLDEAEEELAAVGVGAGVGHGENTTSGVTPREVLVFEAATVDGLTTAAITTSEIATLGHEARNDSVELASLEVQGLALLSHALLASAEAAEVLSGSGGVGGIESDFDSASSLATDGNVEENAGHSVTSFGSKVLIIATAPYIPS